MNAAEMLREQIAGAQPEPKAEWYDRAIEHDRRQKELEAKWEAQRQAEAEAENTPQTVAEALHRALAGSSEPLALNGAGILRAAAGSRDHERRERMTRKQ